jgi:fructokinase
MGNRMQNIYAIGESLLDIIFRNGMPQTAKAGGAMLNSAISLGRAGFQVSFISEYATDEIGNLIDSFLRENGVDTSHVYRFHNGTTALALAFLNEQNNASYSFYKNYPADRLNTRFPEFADNDILLCGSFYAIAPELREKFVNLVTKARNAGTIIIYDPNFRKSHLHELESLKPMIIENMRNASVVRGSDEDFRNIFGSGNPEEAWESVRYLCGCMVYTASTEGVYVKTPSFSGKFKVNKLTPVSTIGAGDNFNAGMIASFSKRKIRLPEIGKLGYDEWKEIIDTAVAFASNVCLSYDNYIDTAFASRYRSASRDQI